MRGNGKLCISTFSGPAGGFTLVELVAVIVILSVAALLVYPKLSATGEAGLRSSAR